MESELYLEPHNVSTRDHGTSWSRRMHFVISEKRKLTNSSIDQKSNIRALYTKNVSGFNHSNVGAACLSTSIEASADSLWDEFVYTHTFVIN
jgi:hypothetical protein